MARLDEAEESAKSAAQYRGLDPAESVEFLRNLPALWEEAPNSRRALAESLFESVEVLGLNTMHVEPTPSALRRGLAEAFRADELVMVGARGVGPTLYGYSYAIHGRGRRLPRSWPKRSEKSWKLRYPN
jgi:hypothetical protein